MKKLIALISAIAVMGTMSMTAFAKIEVAPNAEEAGAALAANATSGYDASFTSADVNTQTTILAVNGTAINTNSIMYINQLAQDSETTINFDLKEAPKVGETVYVYMGGDKLAKKTVGTIKGVADASAYTVTFKNGTETVATVPVADGKVSLPETNPTLDPVEGYATSEYTFVEWVTEDGTAFTAETTVTANTTVYPKFMSDLVYGDVFADGLADGIDVYYLNTFDQTGIIEDETLAGQPVSHLLPDVVCGDVFIDGLADGIDVYYLNTFDQTGIREDDTSAGMPIYVVNK